RNQQANLVPAAVQPTVVTANGHLSSSHVAVSSAVSDDNATRRVPVVTSSRTPRLQIRTRLQQGIALRRERETDRSSKLERLVDQGACNVQTGLAPRHARCGVLSDEDV